MNDLAVTNRALDATTEAGIDPSKLLLEMTEGALIEGGPSIVRELSRLREAGVGLAIDDFGTGYGSLSYLRRFPVDTIKIDRSFIAGLGENADDSAIVEAVTALSHSLKLTAIAEGVERPGQIFLLRELGCPRAQGFLLGPPVPPRDFALLLAGDGDRAVCLGHHDLVGAAHLSNSGDGTPHTGPTWARGATARGELLADVDLATAERLAMELSRL